MRCEMKSCLDRVSYSVEVVSRSLNVQFVIGSIRLFCANCVRKILAVVSCVTNSSTQRAYYIEIINMDEIMDS
jgi:hypothetical protein